MPCGTWELDRIKKSAPAHENQDAGPSGKVRLDRKSFQVGRGQSTHRRPHLLSCQPSWAAASAPTIASEKSECQGSVLRYVEVAGGPRCASPGSSSLVRTAAAARHPWPRGCS